ncbi:hypothetical protein BN14_10269 [Rhizoctonia solani AG-1 IB]|uniref:Uncharacterized protein n=1 Tax=Thanatephorus cucumeris (strain AG1-IB / isolate 7/3/14) TaxID=1108050 RepID=M5CA22_THACB|nr:hypothetical protein BN14_10269 [Rhizoctonia solani AG-1 IB]
MRGWWTHAAIQNLIKAMRTLPNRTPADDEIIKELIEALKGGTDSAQQRGSLMAFIAQCQTAYTRLHGINDNDRLSKQSRAVDLQALGLYQLVLDFCVGLWPEAGIFGPGVAQRRYLAPSGMVRNHSYVEHDGIRYGAYEHTGGKRYCYGYINGRYPVRIDRILHIAFPGEPEMQAICALVRPFQPPLVEPDFPWDAWAASLGASSWSYGLLDDLVAIPVSLFSGTLALFDVPMSYGRYWVAVALDSVSPEHDHNEK